MTTRDPFRDLHGADAYAVLGIPEDASTSAIHHAYRARIRTAHPDTGPGDAAGRDAALLNIARDILTKHRDAYDVYRRPQPSGATSKPRQAPAPARSPAAGAADAWADARPGPPPSAPARPAPPPSDIRFIDPTRDQVHPPGKHFHQPAPRSPAKPWRPWPTVITTITAATVAIAAWVLLAAHLSDGTAPRVAIPKQWSGTWTGEMTYHHSADHLQVRVNLHPGKHAGHIQYEDTDSDLIPVDRTKRSVTASAEIRRSDGTMGSGSVRITRHGGNRLHLVFDMPDTGRDMATAMLKRESHAGN